MVKDEYCLTYQHIPRILKDIPWFIETRPELKMWNMEGYLKKKDILFSLMLLADTEVECFSFHDWLIEFSPYLELNISYKNFNIILLRHKTKTKYNNIFEFMVDTMPIDVVECFIDYGKRKTKRTNKE